MSENKISRFLTESFPEEGSFKYEMLTDGIIGLFVFLFLFLFQPFGLDELNRPSLVKHTFVFGIITFVSAISFHAVRRFVFRIEFDKPTWIFGRWFFSTIQLILLISIMNFLYLSAVSGLFTFSWILFWNLIYSTFLISIFPILLTGLLKMQSAKLYHQKIAERLHTNEESVQEETNPIIEVTTEQGVVTIDLSTFVFAEAAQNYVSIYAENKSVKMIRIAMSKFATLLLPHKIIRVHRSYVVQASRISEVNGNAQGLKLSLQGTAIIIPVSRKYIPAVRALEQTSIHEEI
ncbi:MAG: hypothetical protein ACI9FN_000275 [Saprospiraceae bacterium]|jgi:hypothetical protein